MKPKPIGIVGGAGPLAAISLLAQIFCLARDAYGCWKDEDFPKVIAISFPFSDMLSSGMDSKRVRSELRSCLEMLRNNGAEVIGIACNTLHTFLDPCEGSDLLQIPSLVEEKIEANENPLILCTSTSACSNLYRGVYPDIDTQSMVDEIITKILKGENVLQELQELILKQPEEIIILGCTELSLYTKELEVPSKKIIDPLGILSEKIIQTSFGV